MEDQNQNSRIPSIAVSAKRPDNWKEYPVNTAEMTIEELMAHIKRLNSKYQITQ